MEEKSPNIALIINRLEVIKNLISLEEIDEIESQISKIFKLIDDSEINYIIDLLRNKSYSKSMIAIEAFISKQRQILVYANPELNNLRLEAKTLESQVSLLSNEKMDLEKLIHDFGLLHNKELGSLILEILAYRKEKFKNTPQEQEYEDEFNAFNQEYEISKSDKTIELNEDELKEIKKIYRSASKLCHPDMVSEEQKELAEKIFSELNSAYERNDLSKVKEIFEGLKNGNLFVNKSDSIDEIQMLRKQIEKLRSLIQELNDELALIKFSETYNTIISISDWNQYFLDIKNKLQLQLTELKNG